MSSRSWAEVRAEKASEISDVDRVAARATVVAEVAAHRLVDVRRRQDRTQTDIARIMKVGQRRVSSIESADLLRTELGTISSYIAALGGHLRLVADFGDQTVLIQEDPSTTPPPAVAVKSVKAAKVAAKPPPARTSRRGRKLPVT